MRRPRTQYNQLQSHTVQVLKPDGLFQARLALVVALWQSQLCCGVETRSAVICEAKLATTSVANPLRMSHTKQTNELCGDAWIFLCTDVWRTRSVAIHFVNVHVVVHQHTYNRWNI